jgi:hypothetical protein
MEGKTMNKQQIENLINERTNSVKEETGLTGSELLEAVVNSFIQDYFFEEMTKEELDAIANSMGLEIHLEGF